MRSVLSSRMCSWAICFGLLCEVATAGAASMSDLLNQKDLTPEGLARGFADFAFQLRNEVQEPDTFLERKGGDCADYSNLASTVLTHHGYTTKLVVVMMSKQTHVVCYVKEVGGFLDYNHRADAHPVIPSDGSLEDIAGKVAADFHTPWRLASAFRYRGISPVYLDTVFAPASSSAKSTVRRLAQNRATTTKAPTSPAQIDRSAEAKAASVGIQAVIN